MNCPVCNRNNEFNLSICPSCGAMMNDTVRAELLPKISVSKPLPAIETGENAASGRLMRATASALIKDEPSAKTVETDVTSADALQKQATGNIAAKPTSPTLVEFHSKKSTVPEWRVQLQNAVRQRQDRDNRQTEKFGAPVAAAVAGRKTEFATSGANALKIETVQEKKPAPHRNPTLSSALERIENSRRKFFVEEETLAAPVFAPRPASKNYPFYIASKQTEVGTKKDDSKNGAITVAAAAPGNESGDLDTNKLPPLSTVINQSAMLSPIAPQAKISTSFTKTAHVVETKTESKIESKPAEIEKVILSDETETGQREEADDCAPFSLRFNAGLFDLIIGAFLSLVLLAPFMLTGGETDWLSFTGVLAFLATCSIVMFIYLTTTVGFYGRTFGMRIFSLEVVDIEGENYPTLHQSAVSAAVYLLSLAFGGAGFLTLLFNDDRRAAHDLVSGTIVVKEI